MKTTEKQINAACEIITATETHISRADHSLTEAVVEVRDGKDCSTKIRSAELYLARAQKSLEKAVAKVAALKG